MLIVSGDTGVQTGHKGAFSGHGQKPCAKQWFVKPFYGHFRGSACAGGGWSWPGAHQGGGRRTQIRSRRSRHQPLGPGQTSAGPVMRAYHPPADVPGPGGQQRRNRGQPMRGYSQRTGRSQPWWLLEPDTRPLRRSAPGWPTAGSDISDPASLLASRERTITQR